MDPSDMCYKCHTPIIHSTTVYALGKTWHRECFTCTHCHKSLTGEEFFVDNEAPFCDACWNQLHPETKATCAKCQKDIIKATIVTALDQKWHTECFVCYKCGKELAKETFGVDEGKPHCVFCEDQGTSGAGGTDRPMCAKCQEDFGLGTVVTAREKKWHTECFVCTGCNIQLAQISFHVKDEEQYCPNCWKEKFQPKCKACDVTIDSTEQFVIFEDGKFHQSCFTCGLCKESLSGRKFVQKGNAIFCPEHA